MINPNELLSGIETARLWGYFHKDWLLQIRQELRPQLPAEYRLFVESESVLISPDEPVRTHAVVLPEISVTRPDDIPHEGATSSVATGTAAIVEAEEPCEADVHYTLILRRDPENRVVAALELLSPSNKGIGNRSDRERRLRERTEYLDAGVNLLEIDALVSGERDLPTAIAGRLSSFRRAAWSAEFHDDRRKYRGWGWNERDPLPSIPRQVDDDRSVLVDLAAALEAAAKFNDWAELIAKSSAAREQRTS